MNYPNLARPYEDFKLEIDVTPVWWREHGGQEMIPKRSGSADLIARSMLIAMEEMHSFGTAEIRLSRRALHVSVLIPRGTTMEQLAEAAQKAKDRIDDLREPSFVG